MARNPATRSTRATLSAPEQSLWRGFLAWSETVLALVGSDLVNATGLSRPDFEVLVRLHEAPGSTLTQRDLGESLGLSASRLSHQLEQLEAPELLARAASGTV